MAEVPNPPGFEHDRLEPEAHVHAEHDSLLAQAETRQARRSAIIDRLLQACVFAVYCLGVAVVVLGIAYLGVSRRADQVARDLGDERSFREQTRAVMVCLTERQRCNGPQLRAVLDALANNRTPPPIPPVVVTTTTTRPASSTTMPVIPGQRVPSTTSPPSMTTTTRPSSSTTTTTRRCPLHVLVAEVCPS